MLPLGLLAAAAVTTAPSPEGVHSDERAAYGALLEQQALAADAQFSGACPGAKTEHVSTQPWKVADQPNLPVWREKVRVTGCGHTAIENINVARVGGAPPWRLVYGLPGDSLLVDIQAQQAAVATALSNAREGLPADCSGFAFADIYIAAHPGKVTFTTVGNPQTGKRGIVIGLPPEVEARRADLDLDKAWAEVWPIKLCGRDRTTMVAFIPGRVGKEGFPLFMPVWHQIEAHGEGARPKPDPDE
jgi:hypothetical protein